MKKYIYMALAAIAALSSCSSDDAIMNEGGQNETGVTAFTATIESDISSRATYNATTKKAEWEAGTDQISVDGAVYTAKTTGATSTFKGSGATKGDDNKYHAYFPSNLCSGSTASLPSSLSLEVGKFNMPMYAESETEVFNFKNLCGVLAITVPQSELSSVKSIVVSSDKQMNGEISSISEGKVLTFALASPTDAEKKVTLTAASNISVEGNVFYVPVPANTHNPLLITISDGTETKAMITKKAGGVEVARSTIYPIKFKENTNVWEKALQLGKSTATSIVIETGVTTLPTAEDETHKMLNDTGILWEVLDGPTLRIQTSAPKIIGHGPFEEVGLFQGYSNVTSITGLDKVDFSEVTDMSSMFYGCNALTSAGLNLSSFNTSKVTRMSNMFRGCKTLTGINLSSFNTSNVTQMNNMFRDCNALTSDGLDLSNFNTSKVTTMLGMFIGCNTLTSLNLSAFDTHEVTDMSYMFYGCSGLTSSGFILSSFNTSKVTTMEAMFYNCQKLTDLNLSHFITSNVTSTYTMFRNCYKLTSLTLSNKFVMTNVTNKAGMFADCGKNADSWNGRCTIYGLAPPADLAIIQALLNASTNCQYMEIAN